MDGLRDEQLGRDGQKRMKGLMDRQRDRQRNMDSLTGRQLIGWPCHAGTQMDGQTNRQLFLPYRPLLGVFLIILRQHGVDSKQLPGAR